MRAAVFVLALLGLAALAAATYTPSEHDVRAALKNELSDKIASAMAATPEHSVTSRAQSDCDKHSSSCSCGAEAGCVWVIGLDTRDSENPKAGGMCVEGNHATGKKLITPGITQIFDCWWPATDRHTCSETCTYRLAISFSSFYVRAELDMAPTFASGSSQAAANAFDGIQFRAFLFYSSGGFGMPATLPFFTGSAYMIANAGTSISNANNNGMPGYRGAAFFVLLDSVFKYKTSEHPNGYVAGTGTAPTFTAVSNVGFSSSTVTTTGAANTSVTINKWELTSNVDGGTLKYICYFGAEEWDAPSNNKRYQPYDAKCDLTSSGITLAAGEALGVRMVVASATAAGTANSASETLTVGAGSIGFAPKAKTAAGAEFDVAVSAPSDCGEITSAWRSEPDFLNTLSENVGTAKYVCTYASFQTSETSWSWDPESKIDRSQADANINAQSSATLGLAAQPLLVAAVAFVASLLVLFA
ncbi:uncharacterized protein AMSG_09612 [Thecamonas trahens ATCC 50062]|uniref:Uncharacterized protein n=1 Tax=Thecamonas trahens ATCC 50062 TaxID=461836 RepID=A0A0L0DNX1_THETB|nr:hypothetical protein AMSG_09612 [Thecamonas trahens ATCC 50062]KNC53965.1 hypothetical protein AMSG_09612 [Thecamonas trahens ATCC 50062]|eukprot:XP_013754167.1 hypothetical protein AMSG_09612 [Thecamonas trahens ATCC 50062]